MFLMSVRLSTWVAILAFLLLYAWYRDRRFLLGALGWLGGFEVVFQLASLAARHPLPRYHWGPFLLIGVGAVFFGAAARRGVWPSGRLMILAAAAWVVWLATGFHVNSHHVMGLDPVSEVLNEAAKTLWALAYVLPLWRECRGARVREGSVWTARSSVDTV